MGNLCASSNPEPIKPKETVGKLVSNMDKAKDNKSAPKVAKSAPSEPDAWKKLKLPDKLIIKNIHPDEVIRFKTGEMPVDVSPYDSEDENKWLCNGADEEEGFVGGCKGG